MKTYKIFNYFNHPSHNYSLYSIPGIEWFVLENNVRHWNNDIRPLPSSVTMVPYYESGKYDLAVLHMDQQVIDPELGKSKLYRDVNEAITDIPKIVINHGTPYWPEYFEERNLYPKRIKTLEQRLSYQKGEIRHDVRKLIGNSTMIVNSRRAAELWGFGRAIWLGLDTNEWIPSKPKEPRVVSNISIGGLDYYYGRDLLINTRNELNLIYGLPLTNIGDDWKIDMHPDLSRIHGYASYQDFLGRSLIFFNPTRESPMPRSRIEAMLSGCCVLTTKYHDADKFINVNLEPYWEKCGQVDIFLEIVDSILDECVEVNGFIVPEDSQAIGALINHLMTKRYKDAVAIGQRGALTAAKMFNKDRFDQEWLTMIKEIKGGK